MSTFHKEFLLQGVPYFFNEQMDAPEPIPVQVLADDIQNLKNQLAAANTLIEILQNDLPAQTSYVPDEDVQELIDIPRYNYLGEPVQ
jgi:hypothetical protein